MQSIRYIDFQDLAERCQFSLDELHELLEYGVLPVLHVDSVGLCFPMDCVEPAQKAAQLRRDYALDLFTMGIVMGYLQKIALLERMNASLRSSLQGSSSGGSAII